MDDTWKDAMPGALFAPALSPGASRGPDGRRPGDERLDLTGRGDTGRDPLRGSIIGYCGDVRHGCRVLPVRSTASTSSPRSMPTWR